MNRTYLLTAAAILAVTALPAADPGITLIGMGTVAGDALDYSGLDGDICRKDDSKDCIPRATLGGTLAEGHGFGDSVANASVSRVVVGNGGFNGTGKTFTYDLTNFSPPTWSLMHTHAGTVPGDGLGIAVAALPKHIGVLIIDHDMDLVFRFAERITVLVSGAVFAEGTPKEIGADQRVRDVYLGQAHHG